MSSGTEERSTARKQRHRDHFPPVGCVYATYVCTSASNGLSSAEACAKSEGVCVRFLPPVASCVSFWSACDASCEVQPVTVTWLQTSSPVARNTCGEARRGAPRERGRLRRRASHQQVYFWTSLHKHESRSRQIASFRIAS